MDSSETHIRKCQCTLFRSDLSLTHTKRELLESHILTRFALARLPGELGENPGWLAPFSGNYGVPLTGATCPSSRLVVQVEIHPVEIRTLARFPLLMLGAELKSVQ